MNKHSTTQNSISFLTWCLNEENNVEQFILNYREFISQIPGEHELVVVNDGSTDNTETLFRSHSSFLRVKFLSNDENRGVGYSFKRAINEASMRNIVWQTLDWSYDLSWIVENCHRLDFNSVYAGSRAKSSLQAILGVTARSDTLKKGLVSICNYALLKILFFLPNHDFQNVALIPTRIAQKFDLRSNSSMTYFELLYRIHKEKEIEIHEFPVKFIPRARNGGRGLPIHAIRRSLVEILEFRLRTLLEKIKLK